MRDAIVWIAFVVARVVDKHPRNGIQIRHDKRGNYSGSLCTAIGAMLNSDALASAMGIVQLLIDHQIFDSA